MSRSLRICMVTTFYPPHNRGGDGRESQVERWSAEAHVERYVDLIEELRSR